MQYESQLSSLALLSYLFLALSSVISHLRGVPVTPITTTPVRILLKGAELSRRSNWSSKKNYTQLWMPKKLGRIWSRYFNLGFQVSRVASKAPRLCISVEMITTVKSDLQCCVSLFTFERLRMPYVLKSWSMRHLVFRTYITCIINFSYVYNMYNEFLVRI